LARRPWRRRWRRRSLLIPLVIDLADNLFALISLILLISLQSPRPNKVAGFLSIGV